MTYDKFLESLKENDISYDAGRKTKRYEWERFDEWDKVDHISQSWRTGGLGGGSCWDTGDGDNHYALDSDEPPTEWAFLDEILSLYWQDIPYLLYRKHILPLINTKTYSVGEYYGNYTNHAIRYIKLEELFTLLKNNGKLL